MSAHGNALEGVGRNCMKMQPIPAANFGGGRGRGQNGRLELVAEASADSYALATDSTTTAQHGCAGLGLHACAKAMGFHAFASIGLKCALRHENALLFLKENLCLNGKS
jgi:hypothetical protein